MNARQKVAAVAAAATLVALAGLGTLGRQATQRAVPFRGCEEQLEHFPADVLGSHARHLPDGLIEYLLDDCTTVTSHGPDAFGEDNAGLTTTNTTTLQAAGAPVCATSDRFVAIYLQPSNGADNYATKVAGIQNVIKQVDGKLNLEAQNRMGSSAQSHYRVKCNTDGSVAVAKVKSAQSTSSATFDNLISDLKAKGYGSTGEKYAILWDGALSTNYSGQGTIRNDSSDSSANTNNAGPSYAFGYNTLSAYTWMHEMGHNLGAVQHDAPGSTNPGWHCDGDRDDDIMCYNDGQASWSPTPPCGSNPTAGTNSYDVCHNQYWAPENRTNSTYAGTHWNQAECYARFTVATWCGWVPPGGTPTPTPTATATATAPANTAVYDATLGAPRCSTAASSCDSGATLLKGRDNMSGGLEVNQPNSLDACTDGASGTYHSDENIDALKIETTDGTTLGAGKSVKITANTWAYDTTDQLDLYWAADARAPVWQYITTITPGASGARTMSSTGYVLPAGTDLQGIRASFRYQGVETPCTSGGYDDVDDLAFAVAGGTTPTPTPTPTATITPAPTPTPTPTAGAPQCSNGVDDDGDGKADAADEECFEDPDGDGVYTYTTTDNIESNHYGAYWTTGLAGGCTVQHVATHDHETLSSCSSHG